MGTKQQYFEDLAYNFQQLEKAVYGDNTKHSHLFPSINLFRQYTTRIFNDTYNISGQLSSDQLPDNKLSLLFDRERQLERELQEFSSNKDKNEVYYKLESLLLQIKGDFSDLLAMNSQILP